MKESQNNTQSFQSDDSLSNDYLHTLSMLYMRQLIGDCFLDSHEFSFAHTDIKQETQKQTNFSLQIQKDLAVSSGDINFSSAVLTQEQIYQHMALATKITHCRLCSFAKLVKDEDRFCAVLPTQFTFLDKEACDNASFSKVGFIVDTLRLNDVKMAPNIHCLEKNKVNDMLFDVIEKVFLLDKESVFIFPWFKCVDIGASQSVSMQIRTPGFGDRHICKEYLLRQLEDLEYAVFFGEQICYDLFAIHLHEANGKLLEYPLMNNKKLICVCVPDLFQMLINPKLKKDAFINFVLLKNVIKANSC